MSPYPSLDEMILRGPPGTLLTPICAKEVFVLRTIGTRWQHLVSNVVQGHRFMGEQLPGGFGPTDCKMYITRKYMEDNVVKTAVHEVHIPQEVFEWPL